MANPTTTEMRTLLGKLKELTTEDRIVLHAGRVLTGLRTGERVLTDQAVLIEGGKITSITPWAGFTVPEGVEIIELGDRNAYAGYDRNPRPHHR